MSEKRRIVTLKGPVPTTPRPAQVDEVMAQVKTQLGETWQATRLSGLWVFQQAGAPAVTSSRRFLAALADSVGCTVAVQV